MDLRRCQNSLTAPRYLTASYHVLICEDIENVLRQDMLITLIATLICIYSKGEMSKLSTDNRRS